MSSMDKKRKSTSPIGGGGDGNQKMPAPSPSSLFASVPEVNWHLIASFAAPPDVYNLALSSKHFFRDFFPEPSGGAGARKKRGVERSDLPPRAREVLDRIKTRVARDRTLKRLAGHPSSDDEDEDDEEALPVLATRLLRESLLSSLRRVLEHSESGITLESALALGDLPRGSVLIAGSTMVQTCLGVLWEEGRYREYGYPLPDVDVYCSAEAAPQVRSVSGRLS